MNNFLRGWVKSQKRIVVFAGIFDPVHKGHLQAAKDALPRSSMVLFAPERQPQHKHGATSYEHRLAMLQLATERYGNIGVLDYPEKRHWIEPFFTWVKEQYPEHKITWMIGSDVAEHVNEWPGIDKLKQLGVDQVLVAQRKGMPKNQWLQVQGVYVSYLKTRNHHMSSTYIRANIASRHTALPGSVQAYAKQHKLYP